MLNWMAEGTDFCPLTGLVSVAILAALACGSGKRETRDSLCLLLLLLEA